MKLLINHKASISPQKINLVAELVRKKELNYSLNLLEFSRKKGGRTIHKLLSGAKKTLERNKEIIGEFYIKKIEINKGETQKRIMYRAKGRADRIKKRSSLVKMEITKKNDILKK